MLQKKRLYFWENSCILPKLFFIFGLTLLQTSTLTNKKHNKMAEEQNNKNNGTDNNISELLKKVLYQGVGIAFSAKERVEKAVKDLVSENKITDEEGKKIVNDFSSNIDNKAKDLESKIRATINETLAKVRPATKSELEELKKRVEALEKIVAGLD